MLILRAFYSDWLTQFKIRHTLKKNQNKKLSFFIIMCNSSASYASIIIMFAPPRSHTHHVLWDEHSLHYGFNLTCAVKLGRQLPDQLFVLSFLIAKQHLTNLTSSSSVIVWFLSPVIWFLTNQVFYLVWVSGWPVVGKELCTESWDSMWPLVALDWSPLILTCEICHWQGVMFGADLGSTLWRKMTF